MRLGQRDRRLDAVGTGLAVVDVDQRVYEGKIPGAFQPAGPGGSWRFDETLFWRWWGEKGRKPRYPSTTRRVRDTGGAATSATDWEDDNRLSLNRPLTQILRVLSSWIVSIQDDKTLGAKVLQDAPAADGDEADTGD